MSEEGKNMATTTQLDTGTGVAPSEELDALQAILAAQGEPVSYEETIIIGQELLGFFEALGEENDEVSDA